MQQNGIIIDSDVDSMIKAIYYDIENPASFSNAATLKKALLKKKQNISLEKIENWLMFQPSFTLHSKKPSKFKRRKVISLWPDECWSLDLIDIQSLSPWNKNYKYILTKIDIFSKKANAKPMKRKFQTDTLLALKQIIEDEDDICPSKIWSDEGSELKLEKFYKQNNIEQYHVTTKIKGSMIERFNRTLQDKMYRILTSRNSLSWVDFLSKCISSYNNTRTRSLFGLTPNEAHRSENTKFIQSKYDQELDLYEKNIKKQAKFKVGQNVQVAKLKQIFDRGYQSRFNEGIKKISSVFNTTPVTYRVSGIKRLLYEQELIRAEKAVDSSISDFIDKLRVVNQRVLRDGKRVGGDKEYLLKSYCNPDLQSWIRESELKKTEHGRKLLSDFAI